MKITIVLKIMQIVVQSHNHKIMRIPTKKFKKTSYRPILLHQVQCKRNKGTNNRDLQTPTHTHTHTHTHTPPSNIYVYIYIYIIYI